MCVLHLWVSVCVCVLRLWMSVCVFVCVCVCVCVVLGGVCKGKLLPTPGVC